MTTTTATKTVTAKQIANRAAKREAQATSRAAKVLTQAYCGLLGDSEPEFEVDYAGRNVRITAPSDAEIRHALLNNRVIDTFDGWEQLGPQVFGNLIANGSLKRGKDFNRNKTNNLYWVTSKARELYNLPARITLCSGAQVDYVDAN